MFPTKFNIMSQEIKIEFRDDILTNFGILGQARFVEDLIVLQRPTKENGITEKQLILTLYHEIFHMILNAMGEKELSANERLVDLLANLWLQMEQTSEFENEIKWFFT